MSAKKRPFRHHDPPSDELARLADKGRRNVHAAHEAASKRAGAGAEDNLRIAVAAVRGARLRRALRFLPLVVLLLMAATAIGGCIVTRAGDVAAHDGPLGVWMPICWFTALLGVPAWLVANAVIAPKATRAEVAAERAWVRALPFTMEGYFEALEREPEASCHLRVHVAWESTGVDADTFRGVVGAFDAAAKVNDVGASDASFETGPISGSTNIRTGASRTEIHRNHRVAQTLRRLVDDVLMPLHRSGALSRVTIERN